MPKHLGTGSVAIRITERAIESIERCLTRGEVHGATIVGIDEREAPHLIALIDVRRSGRREMYEQSRECIRVSRGGDAARDLGHLRHEGLVLESGADVRF